MKLLSQVELRTLLENAVKAGKVIRGPTIDELADDFAPQCLLDIARRRGFPVWLSKDGRVEFDVDIPAWFAFALRFYEPDLVELMHLRFLGDWGPR